MYSLLFVTGKKLACTFEKIGNDVEPTSDTLWT